MQRHEFVRLHSITFSGGQRVELDPSRVLVLVGPNNSGKSQTLIDIWRAVAYGTDNESVALDAVEAQRFGDEKDLSQWIEHNLNIGQNMAFEGFGVSINAITGTHWPTSNIFSPIGQLFCFRATPGILHARSRPPDAFDPISERPRHPIHNLQLSEPKLAALDKHVTRTFGLGIEVDWGGGKKVPLRVGEIPELLPGEDRVSADYLRRLKRVPTLQQQGDGIRNYVACLLESLYSDWPILLADEPEAFLHPPQARSLARALVEEKSPEQQLVIATHSADVLRGILDANTANTVIIARIERRGKVNNASILHLRNAPDVWQDPIVAFSSILDGVFHDLLVLCEGDADCRFYSTILDKVASSRPPDVMFASVGGKQRFSTGTSAMHALAVPTVVIADFDILKDEPLLERLVSDLGGDWSQLRRDWGIVKAAIEQGSKVPKMAEVSKEIREILQQKPSGMLDETTAKRVREAVKIDSPWTAAKLAGRGIVPGGQASASLSSLLEGLRRCGLFVVEVGELERFAPSVPNHGPAWLEGVMTKDLANDVELEPARRFVRDVLSHAEAMLAQPRWTTSKKLVPHEAASPQTAADCEISRSGSNPQSIEACIAEPSEEPEGPTILPRPALEHSVAAVVQNPSLLNALPLKVVVTIALFIGVLLGYLVWHSLKK